LCNYQNFSRVQSELPDFLADRCGRMPLVNPPSTPHSIPRKSGQSADTGTQYSLAAQFSRCHEKV
jgi:hypothetical protein